MFTKIVIDLLDTQSIRNALNAKKFLLKRGYKFKQTVVISLSKSVITFVK